MWEFIMDKVVLVKAMSPWQMTGKKMSQKYRLRFRRVTTSVSGFEKWYLFE